jgi:hypothetical protein
MNSGDLPTKPCPSYKASHSGETSRCKFRRVELKKSRNKVRVLVKRESEENMQISEVVW